MANKNKLSIYLIKDEFADDDQKILKPDSKVLSDIDGAGKVYFEPSSVKVPAWVNSFFLDRLDTTYLLSANARVVLITRISTDVGEMKAFALTMGYGKNMLADDVIEDDFGLKVVLNTIQQNSLRRINKINIGGNLKTSNEQLPLESGIDDFGFDIDRDLIGTITAHADDTDFITGTITGGDLLSLTAEVNVDNLSEFLASVYRRYISTSYRENFSWVDHIRKVKDSRMVKKLDDCLIQLIKEKSPNVWMAVPEVIQWEHIAGFRYASNEIFDDIDIDVVCDSFRKGLNDVSQLRNKTIWVMSAADENQTYTSWNAYRCIIGEVSLDGKAYCINNGKWFRIDKDFVSQVNRDYENMPVSTIAFKDCESSFTKESEYTQDFVASAPDRMLCMDAKTIGHGGGRSRVELCDILTTDGVFIHIKPYSGSATLSHLFNQAVVSAELVRGDAQFVAKANMKIQEQTQNPAFLLGEKCIPNVVLAIISEHDVEKPPIPFFSKVALRYTKRRLDTLGCQMSIKNVLKKGK